MCNFAYKTQYAAKPLHIIFDKVDGYIRKYDSTKYIELFYSDEKHERMFDRISYLIMLARNISEVYSFRFTIIKITYREDIKYAKCSNNY